MINGVSFPVLLPLNVALPQAFNSAREKHKIQAKPNFFIISLIHNLMVLFYHIVSVKSTVPSVRKPYRGPHPVRRILDGALCPVAVQNHLHQIQPQAAAAGGPVP